MFTALRPRASAHLATIATLALLLALQLFAPVSATLYLDYQDAIDRELQFTCQDKSVDVCWSWPVASKRSPHLLNRLVRNKTLSLKCGVSDLNFVMPYHIKVMTVELKEPEALTIFCKEIKNVMELIGPKDDYSLIHNRNRREAGYLPKGKYRGQTQSQYLSIDHGNGVDEGKAEAHSAADSSRASVSGRSGMGQAQSQTVYDPSCEDCIGGIEPGAESLQQVPGAGSSGGRGTYRRPGGQWAIGQGGNTPSIYGQAGGPGDQGTIGQAGRPGQQGSFAQSPGGAESQRPFERTPGQQGTFGQVPVSVQQGNRGQIPDGNRPDQQGTFGNGAGRPGPQGTFNQGPALGGPGQQGTFDRAPAVGGPRQPGTFGVGAGEGPGQHGTFGQRPGLGGPGQQGTFGQSPSIGGSGQQGTFGQSPGGTVSGRPGTFGNAPGGGGQGQLGTFSKIPAGGSQGQQGTFNQGSNGGQGFYGLTPGGGRPGQGSYGQAPSGGRPDQQGTFRNTLGGGQPQGPFSQTAGVGASDRGNLGQIPGGNQANQPGVFGESGGRTGGQAPGPQGSFDQIPVGGRPGEQAIYGPSGGRPGAQGSFGQTPSGSRSDQGVYGQIPSGGRRDQQGTFSQIPSGITPGDSGIYGQRPVGQGTYGQAPGGQATYGRGPSESVGTPLGQGSVYKPGLVGTGETLPWPSPGSFIGPNGESIYCCVGPNQNGQNPNNAPGSIGSSLQPNGPYGGGGSLQPGRPLGVGTLGGAQQPGGIYGNGPIGGSQQPVGQYGPGAGAGVNDAGSLRGTQQSDRRYGQGSNGGAPGSTVDASLQPKVFGTNVLGGTKPPGQYGVFGGSPGGTYGMGTNGDSQQSGGPRDAGSVGAQQPGGLYGTGNDIGSQLPGGQFVSGTPVGGVRPGGSYGPGTFGGSQPTVGTYGSGTIGGSTQPGGTYDTGNTGGQQRPEGTYGNIGGKQLPGQYGTGTIGGSQQPGGLYDSGTIGGPQQPGVNYGSRPIERAQPGGHYGTGAVGGGQQNGGFNGIGGVSGSQRPEGLYGSDGIGGTQQSGGPYGTGVVGGSRQTGGSYNTGVVGGSQPGVGQYIPGIAPYGTSTVDGQTSLIGGGRQGGGTYYGPGAQTGAVNGNQGDGTTYGSQTGGQGVGPGSSYNNRVPQNVIDANSFAAPIIDDDSDALASVNQGKNGTVASASSSGGNDRGRAQTQVQGTYTGSGSFSAQAQISDESKAAESQVSGGRHGAVSNAQGSGRSAKSQASVQLGAETGSLLTQAQSDGAAHSSNTQVQGSIKGGMADAQAHGPGSTSSQAQIGFTPYKEGDKSHDQLNAPFVGGGTASSQSSGRIGQSQSQLQGTFKYGISYNGAAQAGSSIDKDAVFPNRLTFNKIDVFDDTYKNVNISDDDILPIPTSSPELKKSVTEGNVKQYETKLESDNGKHGHPHSDHHESEHAGAGGTPSPVSTTRAFPSRATAADYEYATDKDDLNDEYDGDFGPEPVDSEYMNIDEDTRPTLQNSRKSLEVKQSTGGNNQHIVLGSLRNQDAVITQRTSEQRPDYTRVYQPGERVPGTGYTIPVGFTGSVKSLASKDHTYAIGSKYSPSQAQTVLLTPGSGRVSYDYPKNHVPSGNAKNVNPKNLRSLNSKPDDSNRYVSVSKSVTGALDGDNNVKKQYSHTYYTKSSSCGYFTFTCTIVSGSNGQKKVCRPKIPTNPDGTPMKC